MVDKEENHKLIEEMKKDRKEINNKILKVRKEINE